MDPINRSAYAFCYGERTAVTTSSSPIAGAVCRPRVEHGVAIVHEILRCFVPWKRFTELLCGPGGGGMVGDGDVHDASTFMREDQQHEQESARCRPLQAADQETGARTRPDLPRQRLAVGLDRMTNNMRVSRCG